MANLKILDTGYVSNETRGTQTQLSDANRAGYTGSAVASISLNNSRISFNPSGANLEQKPIVNSLTDNSSSLVSVNNDRLRVEFILKKDIVTAGWNVNNVIEIKRLMRTQGLKILYPSATGDSLPTVVEALGAENTGGNFSDGSPTDDSGTVSSTTPYLLGRIKSVSIQDGAESNFWNVSLEFEVSG